MTRYLLYCICLCLFFGPELHAQGLRESPQEDTVYHFYPLDSTLLTLYQHEGINRDSLIFMSRRPVDIDRSKLSQAAMLLPSGSYLRVHISQLSVEKEVCNFMTPVTMTFVPDGAELILFVKDPRQNRLRKNLVLYYRGHTIVFSPGKGGYVFPLNELRGKDDFLLLRDGSAFFARTFTISKQAAAQRPPSDFSGPVLIPTAGYMLLSKPKYMPGDTLKAYTYQIKGRRGKPVRKKMQVKLACEGQTLWQKSIKRQKPGSYRIDLPLPDTFLLNKNYTVQFQYRKRGRYYGQQRDFSYEQYNLDKATYDFFLGKNRYKAGDSILYYISAKDESGFAQPFGRYSIDVFTRDVSFIRQDTFSANVNKPLYHTEGQLSGDGLESHPLPEMLLPPGNSRLSTVFKLINEQNEEKVITRDFEYDNTAVEFVFRQDRDSLLVDYLYRRRSTAKTLSYVVVNFRGDTVYRARLTTPAKIPVRLDHNLVHFLDDKQLLHSMYIQHSLAEQLDLKAGQDKDSVRISFCTLGDRTVYYTILKNGKVLQADSGRSLNFRIATAASDRFEFTLARESTSGSEAAYNHWYIQPERKKLRISDDLPKDILPGASVAVHVQVRDFEGRPAKNVDMSSYAIKNQFKEEDGIHSFYFHTPQQDTLFDGLKPSCFAITTDEPFRYQSNKPLRGKDIAVLNLHRYPYYRFYFPQTTFYQDDMPLWVPKADDSTAQMSIQIIQGRQLTSPVWITADDRPVYYTLSARQNVIALPAGKHRIQCRITNKVLDLGLLDFRARHKKILSVNLDSLVTSAHSLVIKDSLNALLLDSVMTERILDQSYLALAMQQQEARLVFKDMSIHYSSNEFSPSATYFLGNAYTFLGPFYETSARIQTTKDTTDLFLGDHRLHFFDPAGTLIRTMPVPRNAWPANVNILRYNQVFDTLYYPPVPGIRYQPTPHMQNDFPAAATNKSADPLFGVYEPKWTEGDTAVNYVVFDPGHKVLSLAVVQRDRIGKSSFRSGNGSSAYTCTVPGGGKTDLFFQLTGDSNILYRDVPLNGITALYVNTDSLQRDTALLEDLVFYQNVFSSLTSSFEQLFTNDPENVKLSFERSQKGRNSSMIQGRIINNAYSDEDVYLEDRGHFVAGTRMDSYGNFQFLDIDPGNYMIKIHPTGAKPVYIYNLDVRKGDQYILNIDVMPEEKPVVMSAVNPHFELLVRRSNIAGRIRLFDREHKDLLPNARISFIIEGDTLQTVTATGGYYAFPVRQWPSDKSIHLLINAPGFEHLWVNDFSISHELQYDWKFFLQQKLRKSGKDNSVFINGAEIALHIPSSPAWEVPQDSLYNIFHQGPLLLFLKATDADMLASIPLSIDIYKKNRYQRTVTTTIGQLQRQKLDLDPGAAYTIDVRSTEFQSQRILFSATSSGQYQVHLLPFTDGEGVRVPVPATISTTFVPNHTDHGEVYGIVLDETAAPFEGVRVKLMQGGLVKVLTSTEADGTFSVKPLQPGTYDVEFASMGYRTMRYTGVIIRSGNATKMDQVQLNNDPKNLEEIVIVTYKKKLVDRVDVTTSKEIERAPTRNITDMASLSPNTTRFREGLSIGGARADGTVYVLDGQIVNNSLDPALRDQEQRIEKNRPRAALTREQGAAMKADPLMSRLRQLFSDEGYFRTGLRTNKSGSAYFEARFPDDITLWDVHQVALGPGYYFGQAKKQVRAYKPVMINVRIPRYMYLGDSLEIGCQLRNLLDEPKQATWSIRVGTQTLLERSNRLQKGITDSAVFRADSLKPVSFYSRVSTTDSFYDQELRVLPVKEQVVFSHTDTSCAITDTSFVLYQPPGETVRLRLSHTLAEYLDAVAARLEAYPYSCLEQKCSKLKGLIYQERMARHSGQPFTKRKAIRDLVTAISDVQNRDGSFGWWSGPGDAGMTQIALDALKAASAAGYAEQASASAASYLIRELEKSAPSQKVDILSTLLLNGYSISSYMGQFNVISPDELPDPFDQLQYLRIHGQYPDSFDRTKIWGLLQQCEQRADMTYAPKRFSREPHVLLLRAFRLFKETPLEKDISQYMQRYLDAGNHTRSNNTYEQALVLENFFDFALSKEAKSKSAYSINGGRMQQSFPLVMQLSDSVQLHYKGAQAWLTIDREYRQYCPAAKDTFFRIQAQMDGLTQQDLQLNQDYQLRVSVFSFLPYEHVMITIPLPAGTALKHKIPYGPEVSHIEYYNDRVILYCAAMSAGSHDFVIPVRAVFRGKCAWPPARAELMYRPEVYGHNTFRSIEVR